MKLKNIETIINNFFIGRIDYTVTDENELLEEINKECNKYTIYSSSSNQLKNKIESVFVAIINKKLFDMKLLNLNNSGIEKFNINELIDYKSDNYNKSYLYNIICIDDISQNIPNKYTKKCTIVNFASSERICGAYNYGITNTQEEQLCLVIPELSENLINIDRELCNRNKKKKKYDDIKRIQPKPVEIIEDKIDSRLYINNLWWDKYIFIIYNLKIIRNTRSAGKYDNKSIYVFPLKNNTEFKDIDVIVASAPNFNKKEEGKKITMLNKFRIFCSNNHNQISQIIENLPQLLVELPELKTFQNIIYTILKSNKNSILVLGAIGIGVFAPRLESETKNNKPLTYANIVAHIIFDIILQHKFYEKYLIVFPIKDPVIRDIFIKVLQQKTIKSKCIMFR